MLIPPQCIGNFYRFSSTLNVNCCRFLNPLFYQLNIIRKNNNIRPNNSTSTITNELPLTNYGIYQHCHGSYQAMIENEKEKAKNYILIEDKTLKLRIDDKSNLEAILDSPVTNYWDYWIKDKHYLLVNLADKQSFDGKSQSILSETKFPIQSKIFSLTKLPSGNEKSYSNVSSKGIPKNRLDLRLQRQLVKSPDNLDSDEPIDKMMRKFISKITLNELECTLKFFAISSFEELLCQGVFNAFQLIPFGSSVNGLGWGSSGLDLCLTTKYQSDPSSSLVASTGSLLDGYTKRQRCVKMYTTLMKIDLIPGVANANQPNNQTVQLFSNLTSTDVIITCTDPTTLDLFKLSEILYRLTRTDERILQLFHFCKLWAEVQGCLSTTFNNLLLTMMVINYLQVKRPFPVLPPLENFFQSSSQIELESNQIQDQSLSFTDMLQGFFRHIGTFDFTNSGVNLYLGKIIRKPNRDVMFILDPARSSNMASRVTKHDLENLLKAAQKSYRLIGSGGSLQSLLKPITQEILKKSKK